jgi:hypothetical protein
MGGPAGFSGETGKSPCERGDGMRHRKHGKRHGDDIFFVKMDEDVRNSDSFRRWNLFDIPRLGFQSATQFFHQIQF